MRSFHFTQLEKSLLPEHVKFLLWLASLAPPITPTIVQSASSSRLKSARSSLVDIASACTRMCHNLFDCAPWWFGAWGTPSFCVLLWCCWHDPRFTLVTHAVCCLLCCALFLQARCRRSPL